MNYADFLLSLLIWVPVAGGILVLAVGEQRLNAGRWIAVATAGAALLLSVPLYSQFDSGTAAMQFTEFHPWIAAINVNYHVGVDGISMPLTRPPSMIFSSPIRHRKLPTARPPAATIFSLKSSK